MIQRELRSVIDSWLFKNKILIIYGARQVGKTTLAKQILNDHDARDAYYSCEIPSVRESLASKEPSILKRYFGHHKMMVLDEAQFVPEIGQILKIFSDHLPDIQIIATGSSSFELAEKTSEPLTGRALTFTLFPFSYSELGQIYRPVERKAQIDIFLTYGMYPEIIQANHKQAQILLEDLTSRYLYKDIFQFENIRKATKLEQLLQLLALQIGNLVSFHELANKLRVNERTIMRYIDILEKAFVIFRLPAYSRNPRSEVVKKKKIYFYDVGIRNGIIQQYQPLSLRIDKGGLWENFLIVERLKYLQHQLLNPKGFFWRSKTQQEVDYLEELNGELSAYEIKWSVSKKKVPTEFKRHYPTADFSWLDKDNFEAFVS